MYLQEVIWFGKSDHEIWKLKGSSQSGDQSTVKKKSVEVIIGSDDPESFLNFYKSFHFHLEVCLNLVPSCLICSDTRTL